MLENDLVAEGLNKLGFGSAAACPVKKQGKSVIFSLPSPSGLFTLPLSTTVSALTEDSVAAIRKALGAATVTRDARDLMKQALKAGRIPSLPKGSKDYEKVRKAYHTRCEAMAEAGDFMARLCLLAPEGKLFHRYDNFDNATTNACEGARMRLARTPYRDGDTMVFSPIDWDQKDNWSLYICYAPVTELQKNPIAAVDSALVAAVNENEEKTRTPNMSGGELAARSLGPYNALERGWDDFLN